MLILHVFGEINTVKLADDPRLLESKERACSKTHNTERLNIFDLLIYKIIDDRLYIQPLYTAYVYSLYVPDPMYVLSVPDSL